MLLLLAVIVDPVQVGDVRRGPVVAQHLQAVRQAFLVLVEAEDVHAAALDRLRLLPVRVETVLGGPLRVDIVPARPRAAPLDPVRLGRLG